MYVLRKALSLMVYIIMQRNIYSGTTLCPRLVLEYEFNNKVPLPSVAREMKKIANFVCPCQYVTPRVPQELIWKNTMVLGSDYQIYEHSDIIVRFV